jgi:hypothetical protein
VLDGELPAGWGLMVPSERGAGMITTVQAPRLTPEVIGRPFLAAILKRAQATGAATAEVTAARKAGAEEAKRRADMDVDRLQRELTGLREKVAAFEAASGVQIASSWTAGGDIGKAVRAALESRHIDPIPQLRRVLTTLENITANVRAQVDDLAPPG